MNFLRILKVSCRMLLEHRGKSLLAATAAAVGIALVLVTNGIGQGAKAAVLGAMDDTGSSLLVVRPVTSKPAVARKSMRGVVTSLRLEDCVAIRLLDSVQEAAPAVEGALKVRSSLGTVTTMVVGTTGAMLRVKGYSVERGRPFDAQDDFTAARSAILGARVASRLFPSDDPIGQVVRVRGVPFEVIGVLLARGASGDGSDHDNQILIPLRTAIRRVFDSRSLSGIFVTVRAPKMLATGEVAIGQLLRQNHRLDRLKRADDFTIHGPSKLSRLRHEIAQSLALVTVALAAIALVVGGAGIFGIMLLSVQERTAEIGLRAAVGARPRDIGLQFLAEAWLLALTGGGAGAALGFSGMWTVEYFTEWHARISFETFSLALGIAGATGLIAGVFPAWRAAGVPPVLAFAKE